MCPDLNACGKRCCIQPSRLLEPHVEMLEPATSGAGTIARSCFFDNTPVKWSWNRHMAVSEPVLFFASTALAMRGLQAGGKWSCGRLHLSHCGAMGCCNLATISCNHQWRSCNQRGPSHGGGDHDPAVVTMADGGAVSATATRWSQFLFLLQTTLIFATTVFVFCWKYPNFFYHRLGFAGTGVSFCFHRVVFLLEPASHFLGSHMLCFLLEPMSQIFASTACFFC